jgi:hypothetical protein
MKITVKKVKENKDGSADVEVTYDKAGLHFLIQEGMTSMLVEAIMQEATGEKYNVSDILGTLPKKSIKKNSGKSVQPTFPIRTRRSPKRPT